MRARQREPGLLGELAVRGVQQAFVPLDLSLGDRPSMRVLVRPERAAGMNEEDLQSSLASAVEPATRSPLSEERELESNIL